MVTFIGQVVADINGETLQEVRGHVDGKDEWLYVQQTANGVRVSSGDACDDCSVELLSVRRCDAHKDLVLVAVQCRLMD